MFRLTITLFLLFVVMSCDDESIKEVIGERDLSNDIVKLLAPTNNTVLTSGEITFNWERVNNAGFYQLQIVTPTFESTNQIILDVTTSVTDTIKVLEANEYEWRIKAFNSIYETKYSTNSFTVE